jgi:hypothetical protein
MSYLDDFARLADMAPLSTAGERCHPILPNAC